MNVEDARRAPWFHSIDFRPRIDFVSRTRFSEEVPPNYTLFGVYEFFNSISLNGMDCLDVGTMDGLASLIMKARGARTVVATDIAERKTFRFARDTLGLEVDYRTDVDLHSILRTLGSMQFDLVLMAGVLYHVFDPLYAISTGRHLTRHNGLALFETHYLRDEERPVMMLNAADPDGLEGTNFFWRASASCLEGMFHVCGFRVIARISIGKRVTYLVRAVRPSELTEAGPLTCPHPCLVHELQALS